MATQDYYIILTLLGEAKIAEAIAEQSTISLTEMAVGDADYTPSKGQTSLVNEKWRDSLNSLSRDPENSNYVIAEAVIPPEDGGWEVREVGVFDGDGDLFAIGKYPVTYKPTLPEGSGKDLYIRFIMEISSEAEVTLLIDPAVVLATREYVDDSISPVQTQLDALETDHEALETTFKAEHESDGKHTLSGFQGSQYAADAEASDAYAVTLDPVPSAYFDGMEVNFKANTANTGPATLNVNSLGAKTIKKRNDKDLKTGDIESGQIVKVIYDGTYFQMQSQIASIPNQKNFIINGCAQVNQRVTPYTLVKDTYGICADRFYGMATGTAVTAGTLTHNISGGASVGRTGFAFKFSNVTITGTGIIYFRYRMEAKDAVKFNGVNASFSAQVRHDVGSAIDYTIYIRKANAEDNFAAVTAISNDTAQSVESGTNTEIKYEAIAMGSCGNGIEIEVAVECGAITTKNFWFAEMQFEHGDVATGFEYEKYSATLKECERFCWKSYLQSVAPGTATAVGQFVFSITNVTSAATTIMRDIRFPPMRAAPTAVVYDDTGASGKVGTASGNVNGTVDQLSENGCRVRGSDGSAQTARQIWFQVLLTSEL